MGVTLERIVSLQALYTVLVKALGSLRPLVAGSSCRPGLRVSGLVVSVRWPRSFERAGNRPRRSHLAGLETHVAR